MVFIKEAKIVQNAIIIMMDDEDQLLMLPPVKCCLALRFHHILHVLSIRFWFIFSSCQFQQHLK